MKKENKYVMLLVLIMLIILSGCGHYKIFEVNSIRCELKSDEFEPCIQKTKGLSVYIAAISLVRTELRINLNFKSSIADTLFYDFKQISLIETATKNIAPIRYEINMRKLNDSLSFFIIDKRESNITAIFDLDSIINRGHVIVNLGRIHNSSKEVVFNLAEVFINLEKYIKRGA